MSVFHIRKSTSATGFMVQILDFVAVAVGGWLAFQLRFSASPEMAAMSNRVEFVILGVAAFSALFFGKVYRAWPGGSLAAMVMRVSMGWALAWIMLIVLLALTKNAEAFSRIWLVTWLGMAMLTLAVGRVIAFFVMVQMRRAGYQHKRVLLYGDTNMLATVKARIDRAAWSGYDIVGTYPHNDGVDIAALEADLKPDEIWISLSVADQVHMEQVMLSLKHSVANIRLIPDLMMYQILNHGMSIAVGIPMVDLSISPMFGSRKLVKALQDYTVASLALVLLSPLLLGIAIAIKLTSKGPVLFRQKRHGWNGKEILVYKFRSMAAHVEVNGAVTQAQRSDPRVTKVGRFLRKSSLDELPQFFNVLQGRMSVVGPRPHAVAHNHQYVELIPRYALRHKVKPGITGWAQICGYRGETDTLDKMEGRIKHDLYYLENWSLWLDLKVILMTPLATIQNKNVY